MNRLSTKERVLELLKSKMGSYLSGEEIAETLGISRTAVWKAVKQLRTDGYDISALTNKGYMIGEKIDILTLSGIKKYLESDHIIPEITLLDKVDSTNNYLKQRSVLNNGKDGLVVISGEQTNGRGRFGRSFYSPQGGIYMSLLLRPNSCTIQQSVKYTTMAAAAVCEALEQVTDDIPRIKWVNDIYMNNRKVCGILTEGAADLESGYLDYAVLGIGVNVYQPENGFPDEIRNIAGGIFRGRETDMKNRIAAGILDRFYSLYADDRGYADRYRQRSMVIGETVDISFGGKVQQVKVTDIDDECALITEDANGNTKRYTSGEVTIVKESL